MKTQRSPRQTGYRHLVAYEYDTAPHRARATGVIESPLPITPSQALAQLRSVNRHVVSVHSVTSKTVIL